MALRTTWGEVIEMIRSEARLSTNTSRGIDHLDVIKQVSKRHYKALAEEFDWRHLELKRDSSVSRKLLQAGSRYYNYPTAVNPQKITGVRTKWGGRWEPVSYGITYADRGSLDPDSNQRSDPVQRWMAYGDDQFEVWPLPASNGAVDGDGEIAFEGQKKVTDLTEDASRLDMDDMLVVLATAAEILLGQDKGGDLAKVKADAFQARFGTLRANTGDSTRYIMGRGRINETSGYPRHPTYIR